MAELKWHSSYEIGVKFIDDDHKNLLKIILNIKNEMNSGEFSKCSLLLGDFIKETKIHFSKEEKFLDKTNYPGLRKHKTYHKELLGRMEETKITLETMETKKDITKCFDKMARFVFDDILQGDINFKSFLEHEGHTDNK